MLVAPQREDINVIDVHMMLYFHCALLPLHTYSECAEPEILSPSGVGDRTIGVLVSACPLQTFKHS